MRHMILLAVSFIVVLTVETAVLYILFEYIYRYAVGDKSGGNTGSRNGSCIHLLKSTAKYYWWMFQHRGNMFQEADTRPYSSQMYAFLTQHSSFRAELARNIISLVGCMVIVGVITVAVASLLGGILRVVILVAVLWVFLDFVKRDRGYIFEFLKKTEKFLMEFSQITKFEAAQREKEKPQKEDAAIPRRFKISNLLMIFVILLSVIVVLQWGTKLFNAGDRLISLALQAFMSEAFLKTVGPFGIFLLACCVFWKVFRKVDILRIKNFLYKITSHWTYKETKMARNTEDPPICTNLSPWKQRITKMCRELRLETVSFQTDERIGMNARAVIGEDSTPVIIVGTELLKCLQCELGESADPAVRFILGHELAHIYFHDQKNPLWEKAGWLRLPWGLLFVLIFTILIRFDIESHIAAVILAVVVLAGFVLEKLSDARLSRQIMELRADRIGLQLSETDASTFRMLLPFLEVMEKQENLLYRYYKNYIDVEAHPSLRTRLKELERGKKWGILEYVRYVLLRIVSGHGWRL